jgi:hypothetical protein
MLCAPNLRTGSTVLSVLLALFAEKTHEKQDSRTVPNGIKISQKKQKNKVFPTANTKESVKQ